MAQSARAAKRSEGEEEKHAQRTTRMNMPLALRPIAAAAGSDAAVAYM